MPQLEFSYYLSQIFFYLFGFTVMFTLVSGFIYSRIENSINARGYKLDLISSDTGSKIRVSEDLRKELVKIRKETYTKISNLKKKHRDVATAEFNKIISESNEEFVDSIRIGRKLNAESISAYEKYLLSIKDGLSSEIISKISDNSFQIYDNVN